MKKRINITIAKQNYIFLQMAYPSFKNIKIEETADTMTLQVTKITFNKLVKSVKEIGMNPYALISW